VQGILTEQAQQVQLQGLERPGPQPRQPQQGFLSRHQPHGLQYQDQMSKQQHQGEQHAGRPKQPQNVWPLAKRWPQEPQTCMPTAVMSHSPSFLMQPSSHAMPLRPYAPQAGLVDTSGAPTAHPCPSWPPFPLQAQSTQSLSTAQQVCGAPAGAPQPQAVLNVATPTAVQLQPPGAVDVQLRVGHLPRDCCTEQPRHQPASHQLAPEDRRKLCQHAHPVAAVNSAQHRQQAVHGLTLPGGQQQDAPRTLGGGGGDTSWAADALQACNSKHLPDQQSAASGQLVPRSANTTGQRPITFYCSDSVATLAPSQVVSGNAKVPVDSAHCHTWMYPTNKSVRGYQMTITEAALLENTLVCLPTGLGKTFIAAVVMYNFHRCAARGSLLF
jgi:hypothetical protein